MADLSGRQLGNYRLLRPIGSGGFAEVYLGEHVYLNTIAAVKVLQTRLVSDEERDAFCNEARTIARLAHKHIVRVLDFDVENNIPFLVTEYAEHGTLRERYPQRSRLPLSLVVDYVAQIADALQYAHDHRIVHRDVKPENILLGADDEILLSDFGIAIIVQSTSAQLPEKLLGTGAYMAPEQFRGKAYPASDQYALAILVYEWLCGERPFQGSFFELYEQHQKISPPSLCEKLSTTPLALEAVLMRALEKEPEARFPSVTEFSHALSQALHQTNEHASLMRESSPASSTHNTGPLESTIPPLSPVMLETRTSSNNAKLQAQETPPEQETISPSTLPAHPPASLTQATEHTWIARPARSISSFLPTQPLPEKKYSRRMVIGGAVTVGIGVCIIGGIFAEPSIARYIQSLSPTLFTYHGHKDTVWSVSWSPDSKRIASASQDKTVQIWNATTGSHEVSFRGHTSPVRAVAWSPDKHYLASGSEDARIEVWDARMLVRNIVYLGHKGGITSLAWSPDSQHVASASLDETVQVWSLATGSTTATSKHALIRYTGHTSNVNTVIWSPDGTYLASASDDTTVQVWQASTGKTLFTYTGHTRPVQALAWSPDSTLLASGSTDTTVQVWQALTGKNVYTYTGHTGTINALAWSPSGQRIVSASDTSGSAAPIQIWDAPTGNNVFSYQGHKNSVTTVAWSHNGNDVASGGLDTTVQVWKPA